MALTVLDDKNPIKVTGTSDAKALILSEWVVIRAVRWYVATTAGHLLALQDKHGDTIIKMRAEADNTSQTVYLNIGVDEIYCDNMDSGELYIYVH